MGLKDFLVAAKAGLNDLQSRLKIHIVIGNEACDLDSTISAITYAYFLHQTKHKLGTFYLPILNIPREKFRLRLETVYFLKKHKILADDLIFVNDFDLLALTQNEVITLSATLVDHHVLNDTEECLRPFIEEVLDHRPVDGVLPESWHREIEKIGSCCSLVGRKILASETFDLDATVAELLLGTILKDTGNMSASDNIGTPADHEVLVRLKSFLPPSISATSIYEEIRNSLFDLSSLTVSEMLYKDLKVLKGATITVAMSSITMELEEVLSSPEFSHDATEFCLSLPADVLIIMTVWMEDGGLTRRRLAVFSPNRVYREQITDVLLCSTRPNLDLQPMSSYSSMESVSAFIQNNIQATRKAVLPLIRDFLAGEVSTPDENLNASGSSASQFSSEHQQESGSSGEKGDACEEEARRHINIAKAFQCDQFRTSQDCYDLAAVGMDAVISPSLSSDSDLSNMGKRKEEKDFENDGLGDTKGEDIVAANSGDYGFRDNFGTDAGDSDQANSVVKDAPSSDDAFVNNLVDFGFSGSITHDSVIPAAEQRRENQDIMELLSEFSGDNIGEGPGLASNVDLFSEANTQSTITEEATLTASENFSALDQKTTTNLISEFTPGVDSKKTTLIDHITTSSGNITIEPVSDPVRTETLLAEDVLQTDSPFDLLCPNNVDSPWDFSSLPTSGQVSGQGSKVPSYPDTPPNSYMEPAGMAFMKETQLPSFNSSEMVKRIQEKKAALAGHTGKRLKSYDDEDSIEGLCVEGGSSSGGGGSLISPAVPQNSYVDLTSGFDFMSAGYQLPKLTNSDIMERVNEKRSQFEWSIESLDGSTSGVDVGQNSEDSLHKSPFGTEGGQHLPVSDGVDPQVPYTPQNSFVEGNFDSFARNNLPSLNNAEIVAKIKAKQVAMFGSSGSGRTSHSSHGSDDSGGCHSPDVGKNSRGASLDSPQVPYTPQNSYRDNLGVLDPVNKLPDLNEVAERLSIENSWKRQFGKRSTSNSGGGSRDEENVNPSIHPHNQVPQARNSSSQSDSQNTMSDVESLMSVSTDVGTPSENVVASGLAGLMRNEIAMLSHRDTIDSDVFSPSKLDDNTVASGDQKKVLFNNITHHSSTAMNKADIVEDPEEENKSSVGFARSGYEVSKELFSPVDTSQIKSVEDHAIFEAAENIVAQSVAAALQFSQREANSVRETGRLRWNDNVQASAIVDDDDDENSDDDNTENSDDNTAEDSADGLLGSGDGPDQVLIAHMADPDSFMDNIPQHPEHIDMNNDNYFQHLQHGDGHHNAPYRYMYGNHMGDYNLPEAGEPESLMQAPQGLADMVEGVETTEGFQHLADLALNELAFELANELIQSVLDDFPFQQVSNNASEPSASGGVVTEKVAQENSVKTPAPMSCRIGLDNTQIFNSEMLNENAEKLSANSFVIPMITGDGTLDPQHTAVLKLTDEDLKGTAGKERKSPGSLMESRNFSASSLDSNSSTSSSERKRSKDADSSLTILEDEIMTSFPERKISSEFIPVDEEEEIIHSFPGRKFSKSEDFPPRRFSRDDNLSTRMEDSDIDVAIGPENIETDYLPNMDPLQGNLDIIDFTKMTDADREVVEGESFRKVSSEELIRDAGGESMEEAYRRRMGSAHGHEEEDKFDFDGQKRERGAETWQQQGGYPDKNTEEVAKMEEVKKPKQKKKIRVSFSEDFDDEIGDFNVVYSRSLRSPPPPAAILTSQDSQSSSPPLLHEKTGSASKIILEEALHEDPWLSSVSPSAYLEQEMKPTTTGSSSNASEEEDVFVTKLSHHQLPSPTGQDLVKERAQVWAESAKKSISQVDPDLNVVNVTPLHPLIDMPESSPLDVQHHQDEEHPSNLPAFPLVTSEPTNAYEPSDPQLDLDVVAPKHDPMIEAHVNSLTTTIAISSVPVVSSETSESVASNQALMQRSVSGTSQSQSGSATFDDPLTSIYTHARNLSNTSLGSVKGAIYSEEWQDDDIAAVAAQSGLDSSPTDPLRKIILPVSSFAEGIAADDDEDMNQDIDAEDDDKEEEDSEAGDLEWENDTPIKPPGQPGISPTLARHSSNPEIQRWKRVSISGSPFDIDLQAVEPYKNVLSHGGYYDEGLSAIIVFYGCHLPSRRQENYTYLMNHLFHYVIHTLEELVADDYVIIYFHGSTPRRQMPGLGWLKKCYQSIDRRLKKNLKGLYLVHPTIWLRTIVTMIKPFISSKFSSKLRFVRTLEELNHTVPMENVTIPEAIVQLEELIRVHPQYLEQQEEVEKRMSKEEKRKEKERKKETKEKKKQEQKAEKERKKALKKGKALN